ncbi:MAG: hypothetical protein ACREJD_15645 [Phycisphaerales bacterium]
MKTTLVLTRIETLTARGDADFTYEFSDFSVPPGLDVAIGHRRHVTLAPSNRAGFEDVPGFPMERDDVLVEAKVVPHFDDDVFAVSKEGFQDLEAPKRAPPLPPQPNGKPEDEAAKQQKK